MPGRKPERPAADSRGETTPDRSENDTTKNLVPATDSRDTRSVSDADLARAGDSDFVPEVGSLVEARFRYQLAQRLGNGAFGSVFLARCLDAGTNPDAPPERVAIKLLDAGDDTHGLKSLKRELAALRLIQHDRIPALYDWSVSGDVAFVVLEYFPAGSLADTWSFTGRLDVDQTWQLISDLLSALNAAHRASILHLDVKPSNVLLDGNGGYVLTDFGVSHASRMSKGLLHQGQVPIGLGTHGYRAPEQASQRIQSFDLRTDLWGVGATAWAMYTGIDMNRRKDVLRRPEDGHVFGLQRLSDVHLSCPPPLEEVIMGMLYIDPSQRPGGAAEVLSQLRAIASGYGMGSQPAISAQRNKARPEEVHELIQSLMDPLWGSICRAPGFDRYLAKFEDGEVIADIGEQAHHTHLLLRGSVRIEKAGRLLTTEDQEGAFLGAISTLATSPRTVTLRAEGTVWTSIFNEAELEQFITCNPAVAVRIMRGWASRIAKGPLRHND